MAAKKGPKPGTPQAADGFQVPKLPKTKSKRPGSAGAADKIGGVTCGANKKHGEGKCGHPAGWGTSHPGIGKCKMHGGSTTNHVKAAASAEHRQLLGVEIEMNPLDALLMCIRIRAGEVVWLSEEISRLDEKDWVHDTIVGKQLHWAVKERHAGMNDLARFSQMAISLGIAERAVKLAETYGEMLARLIQGILGDLDLSEEQRAKAPAIVRHHLIALDGGREVTPERAKQLELTA